MAWACACSNGAFAGPERPPGPRPGGSFRSHYQYVGAVSGRYFVAGFLGRLRLLHADSNPATGLRASG
jgi:hypothetical protein